MMTKSGLTVVMFLCIAILIGLSILLFIPPRPANAPTQTATTTPAIQPATLDDLITVDSPLPGALVTSPLTIAGKARGNWFFEGSAPLELRDAHGVVLVQNPLAPKSNWMTTDYVPFSINVSFPTSTTATGTLVLKNDNPSGNPATQKELDIPVRFR